MYLSEWKDEDGYKECLVSFERFTPEVLKLRIVLNSRGNWTSIIRDYKTGTSIRTGYLELEVEDAKKEAIKFLKEYISDKISITYKEKNYHTSKLANLSDMMKMMLNPIWTHTRLKL